MGNDLWTFLVYSLVIIIITYNKPFWSRMAYFGILTTIFTVILLIFPFLLPSDLSYSGAPPYELIRTTPKPFESINTFLGIIFQILVGVTPVFLTIIATSILGHLLSGKLIHPVIYFPISLIIFVVNIVITVFLGFSFACLLSTNGVGCM